MHEEAPAYLQLRQMFEDECFTYAQTTSEDKLQNLWSYYDGCLNIFNMKSLDSHNTLISNYLLYGTYVTCEKDCKFLFANFIRLVMNL